MADIIANLIARARQIKNETEVNANTAERVGSLLEDLINNLGSNITDGVTDVRFMGDSVVKDGVADIAYPTMTFKTKYVENGGLQRLFRLSNGGSVTMRYTISVAGRAYNDELRYTNTDNPTTGYFYSNFHSDFIERRNRTSGGAVCVSGKTSPYQPTSTITMTVIDLQGELEWLDDTVTPSSADRVCEQLYFAVDTKDAKALHTSVKGTILDDFDTVVAYLEDDTLYSMFAQATEGRFRIPERSNYKEMHIYCLGDGVATFYDTDYEYKSGQFLIVNGDKLVVSDNLKEYYTKAEIDEIVEILKESGVSFEVVDELPSVEDAKERVIYLVPTENPSEKDAKDEYMLINGRWELIGHTFVDLSSINESISTMQEQIIKLLLGNFTISCSRSKSYFYAGFPISITLSSRVSSTVSFKTADEPKLSLYTSAGTLIKSVEKASSISQAVTPSETTTYYAQADFRAPYNASKKSSSVTVMAVYPIFVGVVSSSSDASALMVESNLLSKATPVNSAIGQTYTYNITGGKRACIITTASNVGALDGGFDHPFSRTELTSGGVKYYVYVSLNTYSNGNHTLNFVNKAY